MIFISYRKGDTQAVADYLAFRLKEKLGSGNIFKDDADIHGGEYWQEVLVREVAACRLVLALIGTKWFSVEDEFSRRRIDDPDDWVRRELGAALQADKPLMILLADGAAMPSPDAFPPGVLKKLAGIQALPLRSGSNFESDYSRVLERILQILEPGPEISVATLEKAPRPASERVPKLPSPTSALVGRQREMNELVELFTAGSVKLVTIFGPPGTGKTRLAIEAARRLESSFAGGAWFAELSDARTATDVASALALTFGVPLTGSTTAEQGVVSFLEYRKPLLVVLDNFEQLVEHAETTVGAWMRAAPQIRFLATSRALLGLAGENELYLDPLATPTEKFSSLSVAESESYDSVKLFVEAAKKVRPAFQLDSRSAPAVGEICARLDGIPLALELAAGRMRVLEPAQMLHRLYGKLDLLRSHRRDTHQRHQTLTAAIEWSYGLLEPWEKAAFLQLAIFQGGCFLESAEAVLDLSADPLAPPVVDAVQSLCEQGLLKAEGSAYGPRLKMLASLRSFCEEKRRLEKDGQLERASWERFAKHYLEYAQAWSDRIHGLATQEALDRLQQEIANCFSAQDWAIEAGEPSLAARIGLALDEVLERRGPSQERIRRLEGCLRELEKHEPPLRAELLASLASSLEESGDWDRCLSVCEEGMQLAGELDHQPLVAKFLVTSASVARRKGEKALAIVGLERARAILSTADQPRWLCRCLPALSWAYSDARRDEAALECLDYADRMAASSADGILLAGSLNSRGWFYGERGRLREAIDCYIRSVEIQKRLGNLAASSWPINNHGVVLMRSGRYTEAIELFAEAERINREFGSRVALAANLNNRGYCIRSIGRPQDAITDFKAAAALNREAGNRPWLAMNLEHLGLALMDMDELEGGLALIVEAEIINSEIQADSQLSLNQNNLGRILARLGRHAEALRCFAEAEKGSRSRGDLRELAENFGNRGRTYLDLEKLPEARSELQESLRLYGELDLRSLYRFEFTVILAKVEAGLGNPEEAAGLARQALQQAEDWKLGADHPAKWFAGLLPDAHALATAAVHRQA